MADGDRILLPELPPEVPGAGRLGRHQHHDPRNRAYPARRTLFAEDAPITPETHWRRQPFNQGNEGSCTGQCAAGLLQTSPFRLVQPSRAALPSYDTFEERSELYHAAQLVDPYVETPPEEGSSTDAPLRILRDRGHIREWRWCFGIEDVARALSRWPVAFGTVWTEGMDLPLGRYGRIEPTGAERGGHAYEIYALIATSSDNWLDWDLDGINSWGAWGPRNGRFRISVRRAAELLERGGEAVTIVV